MNEFILHNGQALPTDLKLPFRWQASSAGPKLGDLGFYEDCLQAFDGERWQYLDLAQTVHHHRPSPKGFASEPLVKALGLVKSKPARVIDASCGTAKDALQIWSFGVKVVAYERHPMVYALLWDGLRRAKIPNFELVFGDASEHKFNPDDVVIFDPMFEQTDKKKSLPRKEMQLFKNAVGRDDDQAQVLTKLLASGCCRVVVKRPLKLESLPRPNHSIAGKSIKYDVYLPLLS